MLGKNISQQNAIILAAGFGMRMVPINLEMPKAFLTINGEKLIERIIRQLHVAGITEIHIVVGFMKEKFEYLIDKYNVNLIVNPHYATHNNISSLALASQYIHDTYIIPSDVWCAKNPFKFVENTSWYMVSDAVDGQSNIRLCNHDELIAAPHGVGNKLIGISYLTGKTATLVKERIKQFNSNHKYDHLFWEEALYSKGTIHKKKLILSPKIVSHNDVIEINTYEQLRDFDENSSALHSDAINTIVNTFHIKNADVKNITVLKKGMTNRSFVFQIKDTNDKYIMRIPGEGTDKLINRQHEFDVYQTIADKGLCDNPIYINPQNGYKITKFLNGVRSCNSHDESDLNRCMTKLREFHQMKLKVNHSFDIFEQIKFYQSLWAGASSMYGDHSITTSHAFELQYYIEHQSKDCCLTHIDAVPDNFLFYKNNPIDAIESLQLTDWEYAGMQDPHVDIAMFCLYSMYDKKEVDHLIDIYFQGKCPEDIRTKIYCYISVCGLLWSNWCEYKAQQGVEFGEYSLRQYRFAKDYYRYAIERM